MGYAQWRMDRTFLIAPAGAYVGQWLQSFREFPPRQKPGSFNLDSVMEAVTKLVHAGNRLMDATTPRAGHERWPKIVAEVGRAF